MTTYYVRPTNGSDVAAGTSFATAFKTTQKAADTAIASDEVRLCAEATETVSAKVDMDTNSGGLGTQIDFVGASSVDGSDDGSIYTIQASASITGILDFNYVGYTRWRNVNFDGNSNADSCILNNEDGSPYNVFIDCKMFDSITDAGIFIRGTSPWYFERCEVYGNVKGFDCGATSRGASRWMGCSIHDNSGNGVEANSRCDMSNCLVYDNGAAGLDIVWNAPHGVIVNCVFFGNSSNGIHATNGSSNTIYHNNVFMNNGLYGIDFDAVFRFIMMSNNLSYGNSSGHTDINGGVLPGLNNQTTDPLFTSIVDGSEDFTPLAGSPLIANGLLGSDIGAIAHAAGGGGGRRSRGRFHNV